MILTTLDQKLEFVQGKVVAGLDVAQARHFGQWPRVDGRPAGAPRSFPNSREGFVGFLADRPAEAAVVVGLESTGPYWLPLAHWLAAQPAVTVVLVNPAHVKQAKELDDNSPTKSDPKDAGVIARLVHQGRFLRWTPRVRVWAHLQSLAVLRQQQRTAVNQWENRIAGWVAQYFPEFRTVFMSWRGKAALWVLHTTPLPPDVLREGVAGIAAGMSNATHHRVGLSRATPLVAAAGTSVGVPEGLEVARYQLAQYLMMWESSRQALAATEAEQQRVVAERGYGETLQSVPGLGPIPFT